MLKVREVHCDNWLLRDWTAGITLYPFIFLNKAHEFYKTDLKGLLEDEWEHIGHMRRIGVPKWYFKYVTDKDFRILVEKDHHNL